jgi:hypothetical protein
MREKKRERKKKTNVHGHLAHRRGRRVQPGGVGVTQAGQGGLAVLVKVQGDGDDAGGVREREEKQ